MDAVGGKADDDVTGRAARAVDDLLAVDDADARAGEVELVFLIHAWELGGLAADEGTPGGATDLGGTLHKLGHLWGVDLVRSDVLDEEERLGAGTDDVVDAMCGETHSG